MNKTYTPMAGEDIKACITNALEMSRDIYYCITYDVKFTFNGIDMTVNAGDNSRDYYLSIWKHKCKERSDAYKDSPEYKLQQEEQAIKTGTLQEELDVTIGRMSLEHGEGYIRFTTWLKRFVELTDHSGTTYNKDFVLEGLGKLGYKENEYVGHKGEWTAEISVKYITGQVINCLNKIGLIPPVAVSMCDKVLNGEGL